MENDLVAAETDKLAFAWLIRECAAEELDDYLFPVDLVLGVSWTYEVNQRYWKEYWDGNLDGFKESVCACYEEFYPSN